MKSEHSIRFDFAMANRRAAELEDIAQEMRSKVAKGMAATMTNLHAAWEGENAMAYLQKANKVRNDLERTAKDVETVAGNIRYVARIMYETEMRALRVAQQRKQ